MAAKSEFNGTFQKRNPLDQVFGDGVAQVAENEGDQVGVVQEGREPEASAWIIRQPHGQHEQGQHLS